MPGMPGGKEPAQKASEETGSQLLSTPLIRLILTTASGPLCPLCSTPNQTSVIASMMLPCESIPPCNSANPATCAGFDGDSLDGDRRRDADGSSASEEQRRQLAKTLLYRRAERALCLSPRNPPASLALFMRLLGWLAHTRLHSPVHALALAIPFATVRVCVGRPLLLQVCDVVQGIMTPTSTPTLAVGPT
jgi:hypothetical protein